MTVRRRLGVLAISCMIVMGGAVVPGSASVQASSKAPRATAAPDARMAAGFSSCRELRAEYKHGVSNRLRAKRWWVKRGATGQGLFCKRVYRQVKVRLDHDRDNIACEA